MSAQLGLKNFWDGTTLLTSIVPTDRIFVGVALNDPTLFPRAVITRVSGGISTNSSGMQDTPRLQLQVWFEDEGEVETHWRTIQREIHGKKTPNGYVMSIEPSSLIQEANAWQQLFIIECKGVV